MGLINTKLYLNGDESLGALCYNVVENGFEIYIGESATVPTYVQYEPYIPNPDASYEENAIAMCKSLAIKPNMVDKDVADQIYASAEDVTAIRSDLDYLMLLNDPDSVSGAE